MCYNFEQEFGGQYGYYTDRETNLLCLTHRYYDPGTGRFLNRDPIGYQGGVNLYGFCKGNPVNLSDPTGHGGTDDEEDDDIFGQGLFVELLKAWRNRGAEEDVAKQDPINRGNTANALAIEEFLSRKNRPIIRSFPDWKPGDPATKLTPEGNYPSWGGRTGSVDENEFTIRGRYWINRAAAAQPGEFSNRNMQRMSVGRAPQMRVTFRKNNTGEVITDYISKEIHHKIGGRGVPGHDEPQFLGSGLVLSDWVRTIYAYPNSTLYSLRQ